MEYKQKIIENLNNLRQQSPLVHNITNYVVMNNTANALLAIGASPLMAHAPEEMEEIVNIASALVINMGTLSTEWVASMIKAGSYAQQISKPIVFDPVGAGASKFRTQTAIKIITECQPNIIRANASEIMALYNADITTKGVDSTQSAASALDSAKSLAQKHHCIVVISGPTDYITNGKDFVTISNGSTMMTKVTGMGCTATAICGAFAGIEKDYFQAAISAMAIMGFCGEKAANETKGPGSLQLNFLDQLYSIEETAFLAGIKIAHE